MQDLLQNISKMSPSIVSSGRVQQVLQHLTPVPQSTSTYDKIPGPLGIEAASLKGKVALVTGSGRGMT